ncbi:MAG: hypothetical protein A2X13_04075 [Bacteroidetes bacterium GWC2_33_15]|nr:MAG: hypothetical protein A2X10_00840 [Bacteroidetes bacterium GWA2_33_15]OFX49700.1 MAG: hypothetical protein A2X13_04075 [Bacteroidetes bacterium GWC2_33_15]OFX65910.1 MAG: hypothetical protein A2X15_10760 [Bacteroidetes bacterium GWB2_32_14]OFX68329.1 MAG: hypothetical protein A2X14_08135 [Bacteroidetes bacterium GWD2_33_33]HAN18114.1 hypothetical protein [Bacteroidales bacterium]
MEKEEIAAIENKLAEIKNKIAIKEMINKESIHINHIILQPRQVLKPQVNSNDMFFYILQGTPEILIGDKKIQTQTNSLIECLKDTIYCFMNYSDNIAQIIHVNKTILSQKTKSSFVII